MNVNKQSMCALGLLNFIVFALQKNRRSHKTWFASEGAVNGIGDVIESILTIVGILFMTDYFTVEFITLLISENEYFILCHNITDIRSLLTSN